MERLGIVLEGVRGVGVVLEQPGRCWSVLEWCWNGMEDVGVTWNGVGVVLEWLGEAWNSVGAC